MKTDKIIIRVSAEDLQHLQKAAQKYHNETGAKQNISAAVRHAVKQYTVKK